MSIARICVMAVGKADRRRGFFTALVCLIILAGCAQPVAPPPAAIAPVPNSTATQPLQQGVAMLASNIVAHAQLSPPPASGRYPITIDPWIDAATGSQVAATRLMQAEIETLAPQHFPQLELLPFTVESLARQPLVLLGAIVPVIGPGSLTPVKGNPGAYRIYGVLADLKSGRVASAESAWVQVQGVDLTPVAFFRDSPVWLPDENMAAYLRTSTTRTGEPIDSAYLQNLQAEALLTDATTAYNRGDYGPALRLYQQAAELPQGGHQLRVYNGVYLTAWALGDRQQAAEAFSQLIDYGLEHKRLGVKFLFTPSSTAFWPDRAISGPYPMWMHQIAVRTAANSACLRIIGHASTTGSTALNDRLSLARARRIQQDLVGIDPKLRADTEVRGDGTRDPIVGTGRDDATDVLDRRVDFQPVDCRQVIAAGEAGAGQLRAFPDQVHRRAWRDPDRLAVLAGARP